MTALSKQLEVLQQKKAALREKETALQKQLKKQQQLERQRRHYLVGDTVLAQAAIDPEFGVVSPNPRNFPLSVASRYM